MITFISVMRNLQNRIPLFAMILILGVGLIPGPQILGVWESLNFFHTFGALHAPLEFFISPRASGDPGNAMLEISRNIINFFGLRLTLETFRIPAILYGWISLVLFFIIARRYFGRWAALAATAMLAVNPMFHQQQHTMTIVMLSGMAFLFFIERLQALEYRYSSLITWSGLAVAAVLVSLHYGVGRIFGFLFLVLWFTKAYTIVGRETLGSLVFKATYKKAFFALLVFFVLMTLLDLRNFPALLRFNTFLFPYSAEIAVISSQYNPSSPSLLTTLCLNGKVFFESFFTNGGDYHSTFSTYRIADYRFPLLHPVLLPFVLSGLIICFVRLRQRTLLLAMPWLSVCTLFFICTLPLFFSLVIFNHPALPNGLLGTISNHRLHYILFPLHLFVAVSVQWFLLRYRNHRFVSILIGSAIISIFIWGLYNLVKENARFDIQLRSVNPTLSGSAAYHQWEDGTKNLDRSPVFASHLQQHAQYYLAAQQIIQEVSEGTTNKPYLISFNINRFTESPLAPYTLGYIKQLNFHAPYLAFYLNDQGLQTAWLLMLNKGHEKRVLGFTRPREYSALMTLNEKTGLGYLNPQNLIGVVQYFGSSTKPEAILATTPEEVKAARVWFDERGIVYNTLTLK